MIASELFARLLQSMPATLAYIEAAPVVAAIKIGVFFQDALAPALLVCASVAMPKTNLFLPCFSHRRLAIMKYCQ